MQRYGGETWELARLYLIDSAPKNSESCTISKSVGYIRKHFPSVKFLVSYADPSVNHHGTVYKAAGWKPDGRTDDERKSPRFDYSVDGKVYSRKSHIPSGSVVKKVPRVSKFRFYLSL